MSGTADAGGPPGAPSVDLGIPGIVETEEIGRGGFAVVYRGRRQGFDQSVAVKILAAALDNEFRQRFDREVRAMGALFGHPAIVGIITAGFTVADRPYIVMEDMTGGSLAEAIRKRGAYSWQETLQIGDGLASALEAAHSAHVLHRDVKPENVLFSRYGAAKLSDFGLAAFTEGPETRSVAVMVSVAHTAPEVLDGAPRTAGTDVYGLASTLMTMILGKPRSAAVRARRRPPSSSASPVDPPPDLRVLGVPDAVCRVLERALAKTPEQRYATATEFRRDLELSRTGALPVAAAAVAPPVDDDKTMTWVAPVVDAAAVPVSPQAPGTPLAPPQPPRRTQPRRSSGSLSAWIAANTVVAAVIAVLIVAAGGTGVYLLTRHTDPTPKPTARAHRAPVVEPDPGAGDGVQPHGGAPDEDRPRRRQLHQRRCGRGAVDLGVRAGGSAPPRPRPAARTSCTPRSSATRGRTSRSPSRTTRTCFRAAPTRPAFMAVASTTAKHCTANGATLPTPPHAGDATPALLVREQRRG